MTHCRDETYYLIVDQGGHASRAVVMDALGRAVARSEHPVDTSRSSDGHVEHDPCELVRTVEQCMEEAVLKAGDRSNSILAAGIATQRSSVVCWDRQTGKALSPVISWQDTRAREALDGLAIPVKWIHERTGLFPSAHYGASKLQWCLRNIPGVREAMGGGKLWLGPMSSYLVWKLTGEKRPAADPVSASRTLLWSIRRRNWDRELLELFEVPEEALPVCVPTVYDYGEIKIGKASLPLKLVTGDQPAALFAHGGLMKDTVYVNMGTGAFVSRPTGEKLLFSPGLLTSMVHEQDGVIQNVLEGTVNGAGSALSWAEGSLGVSNLEKQLPGWLAEVKDPPLFMNGISGLGAPYWDPGFKSEFIGGGGVEEKVVAVTESIAFLIHTNILQMDLLLSRPRCIQVSGGLSNLDGLCQLIADLNKRPVFRPGETEATVRGTCYLLAGQPERWPETGSGTWFEPADGTGIAARYGRWAAEMEKRVRKKG